MFVLISRICAVCFWFPVLVQCLFDSGWKINFEQVQIRSMTMTLASSTLQIRRHEYSGDMNIVILFIFVGIGTLPFYAINMDDVSLFSDSSFLFLANLDYIVLMYTINLNEWISFIFVKKKLKFPKLSQVESPQLNMKRKWEFNYKKNDCCILMVKIENGENFPSFLMWNLQFPFCSIVHISFF